MSGPGRAGFAAILLIGLTLLGAPAAVAAALTAWVDRTTLTMGESFGFVLSLTGGDGTQPPDLAPLAKDFEILDRRRTSRNATVDGKRSTVNEWLLTLSPKRAGTLTIPSLSVAGLSSKPVQIQVTPLAPGSPSAREETRPLFVQMEVGDVSPYVQSEIPVFVRIYDSLGVRSGSISRIEAEGAIFTPRGDQESYVRTIGKTRYRVIEQAYTMVPQRSGTIDIEPITLQANIPLPDPAAMSEMARILGRGNVPMPWLDSTRSRDVTLHSNAVKIEVKPRPADAKGWFLPARSVTLTDAWSPALSQAKVGDTLTRTIKLEAVGASPNQFPPLAPTDVDGVRQYEENSQSESAIIRGEAGATLTKTISVVPTQPGEVTLPAIDIGWWNTATNTQEYARLPAVSFRVQPGAAVATPPPEAAAPVAIAKVEAPPAPMEAPSWLLGLAWLRDNAAFAGAAGGGLLALGATVLWARGRRVRGQALPRTTGAGRRARGPLLTIPSAHAERDLKAACGRNDPSGAHRAYLAWDRGNGARASEDGAPRSPQMQRALADLRTHLYGAAPRGWDGAAFHAAFKAEQKARRRHGGKPPSGARLAPLYPGGG